jgi:hypothetical protein
MEPQQHGHGGVWDTALRSGCCLIQHLSWIARPRNKGALDA